MKKNRLIILACALALGLTAGFFVLSRDGEPVQVSERIVEKVIIDSVEVLVARQEIAAGFNLDAGNLS